MATVASTTPGDNQKIPSVGQKRSRKDADEAPTAPVPDVLSLPLASIMRIVKSKLPDGVMVGTEAKKAFGKACSLFILYISTMYVLPTMLVMADGPKDPLGVVFCIAELPILQRRATATRSLGMT